MLDNLAFSTFYIDIGYDLALNYCAPLFNNCSCYWSNRENFTEPLMSHLVIFEIVRMKIILASIVDSITLWTNNSLKTYTDKTSQHL